MRGLIIGRFQPFHLGHRHLIEHIADDVGEVVVGIGSEGQSHTVENPFTAGERVGMVQQVLDDVDAGTYLVPVSDVDRNAVWVSHVEAICPAFDVVYSNNPFVERLFEEAGYEVRGTPLHNREEYHGEEIRRRIVEGDDWRHLVPDPVAEAVETVGGVQRLRQIVRDDEPDDGGLEA